MIKVLLIGSFLSKRTGTLSVSEKLALYLNEPSIQLKLVSYRQNRLLRFLEIILASLFCRYDKMHIDTFSGPAFRIALVASFVGMLRRKKVFFTLHGGKLPEYFTNYPVLVRRVLSRAYHVQTPSLYLLNYFGNQGFQVNYLPNSIDLKKFSYSRENVKPHTLLWVRAFAGIYNPDLGVRILNEIRKVYPDTVLTMIGPDKGFLSKTTELINRLGLNSAVNITGPIPNHKLYLYYQTHEVFLNTTSYESFGVAVLEAVSCGIPVISTKVGEIPYLWEHEEDMLLVDGFAASDFANEIVKLFESKTLADSLSTNARIKAESFDWWLIKEKWVRLFSE